MKRISTILLVLAAFCVLPCLVLAGDSWRDYDEASPLLVRYNNSNGTGTIAVIATTITITDDGNANTYSMATGSTTVADIYTAITTATNTSGDKNFEASYSCALAADIVTTNYLVVGTNTLDKEWDDDLKWDTSTCLHYDVPISMPSPYKGTGYMGTRNVSGIYGSPDGTGNVTLSMYVDGSKRFGRTYLSPVGVAGINAGASAATNLTENGVYPDIQFTRGIRVGRVNAFVRAARATTATTGGLGVDFD